MNFLDTIRSRDPIPEGKLSWLGAHGGWRYAKHGSQEYAIGDLAVADESYRLKPGERFVRRRRAVVLPDGEKMPESALHLAVPVDAGTWERMASQVRSKPLNGSLRVWDALAEYRRQHSDARRLPLRQSANPDVAAMQAELGMDGAQPWLELTPQGLADTSPAGLVSYLQARGISLSLARGRLVARSAKPINVMDRQLMERAEPLIIGELGGPKPMCSECPQPATEMVIPRAPMCAGHAQ